MKDFEWFRITVLAILLGMAIGAVITGNFWY